MKQAIVMKRKLMEHLRDQVNNEGRQACIWFDAYYNTGSIDQDSQLNSDLLTCDLFNIYRLDVIYQIHSDQPDTIDADMIFDLDNMRREQYADDTIWRHKDSPSMSVGDIIFFADLDATYHQEIEYMYQTDLNAIDGWICCRFGWRKLEPIQKDIFKSKIGSAAVKYHNQRSKPAADIKTAAE